MCHANIKAESGEGGKGREVKPGDLTRYSKENLDLMAASYFP